MPADIRYLLQKMLADLPGILPDLPGQDSHAGDFSCRPVGGGSINSAFQILSKPNKRWFGKFNNARQFPGLFIKERNGLALIRRLGPIRVPAVVACAEVEDTQVLLLEWIDEGLPTEDFWRRFGHQLALQHRVSSPESTVTPPASDVAQPASAITPPASSFPPPAFGLGEDNYMGALVQDNTFSPTWVEFFRDRRLDPQVRIAADKGLLDTAACRQFERLYDKLPEFFPVEPPSLLHGDLWSGNFLCDTAGQPVLIDPAVYFGHRHMDLAMTILFGGFEPAFYEAYNDLYPFPPGYRQQWEIANLYPLLIHLNLFGSAYAGNILHTIRRF
jgi:fructosamine-3-kinase